MQRYGHYSLFNWMSLQMIIGCSFSAAICNYIVKNYVPDCTGAGADATRICMAIGAPIPFKAALWRILLSSFYLGLGNPLGIEAPVRWKLEKMNKFKKKGEETEIEFNGKIKIYKMTNSML
jgi:hypothetical protein